MAFFSPQASTQVFLHLSVSTPRLKFRQTSGSISTTCGRGLRERDVDRLALAQALVELIGELRLLVDAVGDALLAAGAEVLVDVARLAFDGDGEVADVAVHLRRPRNSSRA